MSESKSAKFAETIQARLTRINECLDQAEIIKAKVVELSLDTEDAAKNISDALTTAERDEMTAFLAGEVAAIQRRERVIFPDIIFDLSRWRRIRELRMLPYSEYLKSDEWRETSGRAIQRAKHHCQICGKFVESPDVHHLTYARIGCELPEDLQALCRDCHATQHNKGQQA
jgi:hypothetical protein